MTTESHTNGSFYEAIGPTLVMAQCFAIMPVIGVKGTSPSKLNFKWKNLRTIYSVVACVLLFSYLLLTISIAFEGSIQVGELG